MDKENKMMVYMSGGKTITIGSVKLAQLRGYLKDSDGNWYESREVAVNEYGKVIFRREDKDYEIYDKYPTSLSYQDTLFQYHQGPRRFADSFELCVLEDWV
jgi:hypothetical protein